MPEEAKPQVNPEGADVKVEKAVSLVGAADPVKDEKPVVPDGTNPEGHPKGEAGSPIPGAAEAEAEAAAKAKAEAAENASPTEYQDFTVVDGIELDTERMGKFKDLAKGDKLSQDQAQKYVDLGVEMVQQIQQAVEARDAEQIKGWEKETKKDPKWKEKVSQAKTLVDKYGNDDAKALINHSWVGTHPAIVELLSSAWADRGEDPHHQGETGHKKGEVPTGKVLFPYLSG